MTNFERIKQMDIYEMRDFLMHCRLWCACVHEHRGCDGDGKQCENGVIDWLNQEAEVSND